MRKKQVSHSYRFASQLCKCLNDLVNYAIYAGFLTIHGSFKREINNNFSKNDGI